MRLTDLEFYGPKIAHVCGVVMGGAATVAAAVLTAAGDVAVAVMGVPLPVVMASAAGAGLARSFLPAVSFWQAAGATGLWTVLGCAGAPFAQSALPALLSPLGVQMVLPANALAGIAATVASSPWWGPKVWPLVVQRFPWLRSPQDGQGGQGGGQGGGHV